MAAGFHRLRAFAACATIVASCSTAVAADVRGGAPGAFTTQAAPPPDQTIFSLAGYHNAICNDGSPGAYYFRKSTTGSRRWVFYLEGGQQCHDVSGCEKNYYRNMKRTTSIGWSVTKSRQGIMSTKPSVNPTFYDGNIVQVHACSSDVWSGDKLATTAFLPNNADTGWNFQGRTIAKAALLDLAARDADTGFSTATDFLFSGSSAGGLGITYLINDLIHLAPSGARLLLAEDAGFALQFGSFNPKLPPTYIGTDNPVTDIVTPGIPFWNGHGDTRCAKRAVTFDDQAACYDTSKLLSDGTVTIPTFILQYELDEDELNKHNWKSVVPQDTPHAIYEQEFADAMRDALAATGPQTTVFAPQRIAHTMLPTDLEFTSVESFPGYTLTPQAALANWFSSPSPRMFMFGNGENIP